MAGRRMGIIAFLFCLCLFLTPGRVHAVSTAEAKDAISPEKACTLSLTYRCNGTTFSDVPVNLYKIADVSADYQYTLTEPFVPSGLVLNGIQSIGEWNVIRGTLETYIVANHIEETFAAMTDRSGQVCFEALNPGLYLAVNGNIASCSFDAALVSLPGLGVDGLWQYQVTATPKGKEIPPAEPDEKIEYKVLKLWRGDNGQSCRPESIQVELFRNGTICQTVRLSKENNWSYRWMAENDGANWTVSESEVPAGYVMTVEKRGTTFVLTNTRPADDPPSGEELPPADSPQTGDSSSALLYTVLMYISGSILVILGLTGKRKCA